MRKGKLIVIYGINNIGKSTQAKLLLEKFKQAGVEAEYLKYPIYDLAPTGKILNDYLRKGNPDNLTPRENQIINAMNRTQFEPVLKEKLNQGIHIIAENYLGTGIAWGAGAGVNLEFLKKINSRLKKEDLAFFFHGKRFKDSIEKGHQHETNEELIQKVQAAYLSLAKKNSWEMIDANKSREKIHEKLWKRIQDFL